MKYYDFEKAKKIIEEQKDEIEHAELGMSEMWKYTCECVFKKGKFQTDLSKRTEIRGVEHSEPGFEYNRPTLKLFYKNGKIKNIRCYIEKYKRKEN